MNHFDSSLDEYEDVPSPFKTSTTTKSARSNLFSRPVGTVPSEAPVVPAATTRKRPSRELGEIDMIAPKRRVAAAPQIEYLDESGEIEEEADEDEDEEVTERRPAARPRAKAKAKTQTNLLPRIGWGIAVFMLLRLIFMERGVLQYWKMSGTINEHEQELARVKKENADIRHEIRRIEFDKGHQKQLAKEHLGVIAADEFLILFAGEAAETETPGDHLI